MVKKMIEENFLDELLSEVEQKEEEQTESYFDLVLLQIKTLNKKIEKIFAEADKECELIKNFALMKNAQTLERVKVLERKLEAFIRERKEKTIELCNGTLKVHKKPDKIEISDLNLFLKSAKAELLTVVPETVKPDINAIKVYIKKNFTPAGVTVVLGKEEFSYKLKENKEVTIDGRSQEITSRAEPASTLRAVI